MEHFYKQYKDREWIYQLATLAISIVFVHAIYAGIIRPLAADAPTQSTQTQSENSEPSTAVNIAIILKDYEQEICFIAAFWAFFIMLFKWEEVRNTRRLFLVKGREGQDNFLETTEGVVILPERKDTQKYLTLFENLKERNTTDNTLYKAASACLDRFFTTSQVADATEAMQHTCDMESERLETGMSVVRYLIWVIPSLGFIGTVRGIGNALGQAEEAVQGNIAPVTESLGTAFNSTLIALMISIVVMFFSHRLQESQESLILEVQNFCDKHLLRYLREK